MVYNHLMLVSFPDNPTPDSANLDAWLDQIKANEILQESEKARIINLAKN